VGSGDWGLAPIPNPQSPIPNPKSTIPNPQYIKNYYIKKNKYNLIFNFIKIVNIIN